MSRITVLAGLLAFLNVARPADTLSIGPAHALPDYTKVNLATNSNSAFVDFNQTLGLGDFNGDGRLDIAVTLYRPPAPHAGVSIQLQGADGSLMKSAEYAFPTLTQPAPVWDYVMADYNEDGHLDFIAAATGNDLIMFHGRGDGTFDSPYFMGLSAPGFLVAADLNGDHHVDLVAGKLDGTVGVFLGNGNGQFAEQASLDSSISAVHPRRGQIMVADLNLDGSPDVAVAATTGNTSNGTLDVHLGNGDGTFKTVIRTPAVAVWKGVLGDFNGDGIPDFAGNVHLAPQRVEIWLGRGDGRFTKKQDCPLGLNSPLVLDKADAIQTTDLNDDGILDLVVSGQASQVTLAPLNVLLGNGDGTFQPRQEFTPLNGAYISNSGPRFGDFNGDGRLDLVSQALFWSSVPTNRFGPYVLAVALNPGKKPDPNLGFQVKVRNSAPGTNGSVVLEASTNLEKWTPLATNVASVASWTKVDRSAGSQPHRFYRTRRQ